MYTYYIFITHTVVQLQSEYYIGIMQLRMCIKIYCFNINKFDGKLKDCGQRQQLTTPEILKNYLDSYDVSTTELVQKEFM